MRITIYGDRIGTDMLADLGETLCERRAQLRFAEFNDPVKDKLRRFNLYARFDAYFCPTVGEAVEHLSLPPIMPIGWTVKAVFRREPAPYEIGRIGNKKPAPRYENRGLMWVLH